MNRIEINVVTGEVQEVPLTNEEIAEREAAAKQQPSLRALEIRQRLEQIDQDTLRPLRAVLVGTASQYDHDKLAALEAEAAGLREELKALEA